MVKKQEFSELLTLREVCEILKVHPNTFLSNGKSDHTKKKICLN